MRNVLVDDNIDFEYYMSQSEADEKVRPASDYLNKVMHILSPAYDSPQNQRIPFANCFVEFRPGEVTLWAGLNGSGKSMIQGQIIAHLCQKEPACIASFEMKPDKTLARICKQALQAGKPTQEQVKTYLDSTNGKLWLYDQQGTIRPEKMIAVAKHCAEKLGCKHIAIDSLMKCVRSEDDYNGQKDFVDELTQVARDYNTHIHLVHHLRKSENDIKVPNKMDIKGTGAIADLVDNILLFWRNREKERKKEKGETINPNEPDAVLICDKQRNGEWEGRTRLYYSIVTNRYADRPIIL